MKQPINLLDLIPKEKLDEILQAVDEACGISSVIVDTVGRPISSESNFTRFCKEYCRATEKGRLLCYASDAYGGAMALNNREPFVYDCLNAGLVNCAAPIIVDGHHLANLAGGQVLEEPIPDAEAIERARAIGIEDIDGYLAALRRIPRVSRTRLRKIVNLMAVITGTISDMAMQKNLLAKQSGEYLNKVINSVSDCIISIDADFRIVMSNEICAGVLGVAPEELNGWSLLDFFPDGRVIAEGKKSLDNGTADSCRVLLTALKRDGGAFPVQVSLSRVNGEDGAVAGYVAVIRDISEEKRVEKMKDDLVGMLTHDMRNPILAIDKTLELLSNGKLGPVNEQQHKIMKLALNTNDQLGNMVNSLLDIFRNDNNRFELSRHCCEMNRVMAQCIEDVSLIAGDKGVEISFTPRTAEIQIMGDLFRIRRTIGNLLANAVNFSVSGGRIRVVTAEVRGSDAELAAHTPPGLKTRIALDRYYFWGIVADTGYGIPEEDQEAVFEKFFTVKRQQGMGRRGIGLGLAFCKLVVDAHDGVIFCRTPAGADAGIRTPGVEFHMILPCCTV